MLGSFIICRGEMRNAEIWWWETLKVRDDLEGFIHRWKDSGGIAWTGFMRLV
jgi:hypothetical protein